MQNILYFRFANASSSRSGTATTSRTSRSRWPSTSASRAAASSTTRPGVIRDVIQNHLLQVVSYLAMEAPSSTYAEAIRDEQAKVLRNVRPLIADELVRGQFRGYRDEPGVAPDSHGADLRRPAPARRFLALARRPVLRPRRQVPAR